MNIEVRKRKKRFWAFCLALAVMLSNCLPMTAQAVTYEPINGNNYNLFQGMSVSAGDVLQYSQSNGMVAWFFYYDAVEDPDNSPELMWDVSSGNAESNIDLTHTVMGYYDTGYKGLLEEEQFKEWKIGLVEGSGALSHINFYAVGYTKSNISYYIDGKSISMGIQILHHILKGRKRLPFSLCLRKAMNLTDGIVIRVTARVLR